MVDSSLESVYATTDLTRGGGQVPDVEAMSAWTWVARPIVSASLIWIARSLRSSISHTDAGFQEFFRGVEVHRQRTRCPVDVAMEGYNGYTRPLDRLIREKGYRLYNASNMKLARFKEVSSAQQRPI